MPIRKSYFLVALDVPKGIADVLKIESHYALQEARPCSAPVSEDVAVRALTHLVSVWTGEGFLLRSLWIDRQCIYTKAEPQ